MVAGALVAGTLRAGSFDALGRPARQRRGFVMRKLASACLVGMVVSFAGAGDRYVTAAALQRRGSHGMGFDRCADARGVENGDRDGQARHGRVAPYGPHVPRLRTTIDFYMPEGGNSGLGLRGSSGGDPAFTALRSDARYPRRGRGSATARSEAVAPARCPSTSRAGNGPIASC